MPGRTVGISDDPKTIYVCGRNRTGLRVDRKRTLSFKWSVVRARYAGYQLRTAADDAGRIAAVKMLLTLGDPGTDRVCDAVRSGTVEVRISIVHALVELTPTDPVIASLPHRGASRPFRRATRRGRRRSSNWRPISCRATRPRWRPGGNWWCSASRTGRRRSSRPRSPRRCDRRRSRSVRRPPPRPPGGGRPPGRRARPRPAARRRTAGRSRRTTCSTSCTTRTRTSGADRRGAQGPRPLGRRTSRSGNGSTARRRRDRLDLLFDLRRASDGAVKDPGPWLRRLAGDAEPASGPGRPGSPSS